MSFCEDTKDVHFNPYKIPVEDSLYYYRYNINSGVNSEGKIIVTESWDGSTPISESTAKYLMLLSDEGLRAKWVNIKDATGAIQTYITENGDKVPDSYTNTSVTIGGNTWDWPNHDLINPIPENYVPSNI